MESKENSHKETSVIIILIALIAILISYTAYKQFERNFNHYKKVDLKTQNTNDNKKKEKVTYHSYTIGDKVKVKLNDVDEGIFYVLKASSQEDEFATLFAEKNIGTGAFNNNYTDGNEYVGSLIEEKLNELTSSWTNVNKKRLITINDIKSTGLTETKPNNNCITKYCTKNYTCIKKNSFLLYPGYYYETKHEYELYWTMTKVKKSQDTNYNDYYVYFVDIDGCIHPYIVGYTPGGNYNKNGTAFNYFGIRPVIEISKKYIS